MSPPAEAGGARRVLIRRLDPGLPLPSRARPGDAGVDLRAAIEATLRPGERITVGTGVAVAIPEGYAGLVTPRSGLAQRHGLGIVNAPGIVDAGYRGEIRVILVNLGGETVTVARGDRIAQLVVVPVLDEEMQEVGELPPSERGEGGFGSSGL
ncbi:MAG: dUTP diphosphatase [Acidimicrobiia bacterium]|nr:dUTP diphosphatase [Acidimicrobiia bacterium]